MGKSTTTKSSSMPPPWVSQAQQGMLSTAQGALAPYIAGGNFNADQQRAWEMIRANADNPQFTAVTPVAAQAAQLDPSAIAAFQSPYTNQVINTTLKQMRGQQGQDLNAIRGRQAATAAFGGTGSRGALQQEALINDFGQRRAQTMAQLRDQAFRTAAGLAQGNVQNQQAVNMANAGYGNQAQFYNAQGIDAARQNAVQQLLGIGNYQYGQPMEALKVLQAFMPRDFGTNKTETTPGQSPLQTILGLAGTIGGAAMTGGGSLLGNALGAGLGLFGGSKG